MTPAPATPETAAMTCPRRTNTHLPGTIHKRLQITAVLDAKAEPDQTITELTFESAEGDLGVFSDLPLVTGSELIGSLRALG